MRIRRRVISIVIPALNEAHNLKLLLEQLKHVSVDYNNLEILIADGGSVDDTERVCRNFDVLFVNCLRAQRAAQMNVGGRVSKGEILYFLHADSKLPQHFDQKIKSSLENGAIAGCFNMKFDDVNPILSFFGWFTQFDLNILRGGDQSLFIKRSEFENIGGFNDKMDLMEDYDIIKRIKQRGKFEIVDGPIITSSRTYKINGVLRLQFIYLLIQLMYRSGFSQKKLVAFYKKYVRS